MQPMPDLKLVVEEKRGAIDVFTLWLPRIGDELTAPVVVLPGPKRVQPAIAGRRRRAIEVTAMTDPTSSGGCGPVRCQVCVVAR
jgi:hypothetical protein